MESKAILKTQFDDREFFLQHSTAKSKLTFDLSKTSGSVPEWLKGTGCKPVGVSLRWFESNPAQENKNPIIGSQMPILGFLY